MNVVDQSGKARAVTGHAAGDAVSAHVAEQGIAAFQAVKKARNLSTTSVKWLFPSGARQLTFQYRLYPGSTATADQRVRIVLGALSDADAAGKFATDEAFWEIFQGDDLQIVAAPGSLIYRVDVAAAIAVGSEKTLLQVIAGVNYV